MLEFMWWNRAAELYGQFFLRNGTNPAMGFQ